MAIDNLTGTTWYFGNSLAMYGSFTSSWSYNINFTSNGGSYIGISTTYTYGDCYLKYGNTNVYFYDSSDQVMEWYNYGYRTITITGGDDADNPALIAWLEAHATPPPVTLDLSSLSLSPGTYSVYVEAEADGYASSNRSTALSYTVVPTGYTVSGTNDASSATAFYSTDDGNVWTAISTGSFTLTTLSTFKLKLDPGADYLMSASSTQLGLNLPLTESTVQISNNYTLTQNITDLTIHGEWD